MSNIDKWSRMRSAMVKHGIFYSIDQEEPLKHNFSWIADLREFLSDPMRAADSADLLWELIKHDRPEVFVCTGVAGILLATNLQQVALRNGHNVKLLIVREKRKNHNREKIIEGIIPPSGARAYFIDDIINGATTFNKCLKTLNSEGVDVQLLGVGTLLDFYFRSRALTALGIKVKSVFTRHDLGITRTDPGKATVINNKQLVYLHQHDTKGHNYTSPPVIKDSLLYLTTNDFYIRCFDIETNELVWEYHEPLPKWQYVHKGILNKISVTDDSVLFTSYHGMVTRLDRISGKPIWRILADRWVHSSVVVDETNNSVFLSTESRDSTNTPTGDIVCLEYTTGLLKWRSPMTDLAPCTPTFDQEHVYSCSNDSTAYCVNKYTGELVWKSIMRGTVKGTPLVVNELVYYFCNNGYVYAFNKQTGRIVHFRKLARLFNHVFPLIVNDSIVVIDGDGYVKSVNSQLEVEWLTRIRGSGIWYPAKHGNSLFFTTTIGYLVELDSHTGDKISYNHFNTHIGCPPAVDDRYLAIYFTKKGLQVYERNQSYN